MPLGARRPVTPGGGRTWHKFVAVDFESLVSVASVCFPLVRNTKVFCCPGYAALRPFLVWSGIYTSSGGRKCTSCAEVQRLACLLRKRITVACICIIVASNAHISSWISSPRVRACSPVFRWRKISWLAPSHTHGDVCFKERRSYRCIPHCIAAASVVWIWFAVRSFTS